jgi:hypothetical protein
LVDECEQRGGQTVLETDGCLGPVAQVVVVRGEQVPLLMEMLEVAIRVRLRSFLSPAGGAQPENAMLLVDPGRTSVFGHTHPEDERMVDGEDPLLALRRGQCEPANLG